MSASYSYNMLPYNYPHGHAGSCEGCIVILSYILHTVFILGVEEDQAQFHLGCGLGDKLKIKIQFISSTEDFT